MYDFDWQDNGNDVQYAECDDPRLLLVIERSADSSDAPDGDAYAPAHWGDGVSAGDTYDDDDVVYAYFVALRYFQDSDKAERYLRIVHDSGVRSVWVRNEVVYLFDTPAFRHYCGIPDTYTTDDVLAGDVETWRHYLNGDVFGAGYAVNLNRTDDSAPVDLDDFEITLDHFGLYGEQWAREEASEIASLAQLPPMLF